MATIEIRKKSVSVWTHTPSDFEKFIQSRFRCKVVGDYFRVVEFGGRQLAEYLFSDVTVYDDTQGGGAETFSSGEELMLRLESLEYPAFTQGSGGGGVGFQPVVVNPQNGETLIYDNGVWKNGYLDLNGNRFITVQEIPPIVNGEITLPEGFVWVINTNNYFNANDEVFEIEEATVGFYRTDIIVAQASETQPFVYIQGVESEDTAVPPIVPDNTLLVTSIPVFGDQIGTPTAPIDGSEFIKKISEQWAGYILTGVGGLPILPQINENNRNINITGNPTGLSSLGGFSAYGGASIANFWDGMTVKVHNATDSDQVIKHNYSSATIKFLFPKEEDYIIKPNETITFTYRGGALDFESITTEAKNQIFDDTITQLGVDNSQDAIVKVYEKAIVKDYINIIDFGAVGDGVTESAEFIQDALDFAETNGIRRVYAPSGEYLLEKTIYIPTEIEFYGDGMDKSVFKIDNNTILDVIGMFEGSSSLQNFYIPVICTKTTRTGTYVNNILLKDFKIDDIYYDDSLLNGQTCPVLFLNARDSKIECINFGNVQTEKEQDGSSQISLGLSIVFSENIVVNRCVHGYAGYEGLSIRFLSKNIYSSNNVFYIDKPLELASMVHAVQVARPTSMVTQMQDEYGETMSGNYTSVNDVFVLKENVNRAVTAHASYNIAVDNSYILNETSIGIKGGICIFDGSSGGKVSNNIIDIKDASNTTYTGLRRFSAIELGSTSGGKNNQFTVSDNTVNLELSYDLSSINEINISAVIGNLRNENKNVIITGNVVNVKGTGVRYQAVFGANGENIVISDNAVNFEGEVSENMRAFVVEGGDRINITNNTTIGEHAYSLKVNNAEVLSNFINGVNNFSGEVLNNQKTKTKTVAYIEDGLPISVFNQVSESSVNGNDGVNLFDPDYGFPMLFINDLKDGNSFIGEFIIHINNQDKSTSKVIELFGAEIYNDTNPSDEITAKISYRIDFLNPDSSNIDYKLTWQYLSSGELLFGEHTGTIDRTENHIFDLIVTGHSNDVFTLKSAYLNRTFSLEERLLSTKTYKLGEEIKTAIYTNLSLSNNLPQLNTIQAIDEFISSLKTAGIWSKIDIFSLFQMNDNTLADFALYDYKRGTFMTSYGGMIYDEFGYQGNGTDGYIDTEFNPSTDATNYALNDASRFFWLSKNPTAVGQSYVDVSSNTPNSGNMNYFRIHAGTTRMFINQGTTLLSGGNVNSLGLGFKAINRTSSTDVAVFNGTTKNARTATSSAINNAKQLLFTSENGYSDMGLGFYAMGASLTDQDVADITTFYNEYLTEIGL